MLSLATGGWLTGGCGVGRSFAFAWEVRKGLLAEVGCGVGMADQTTETNQVPRPRQTKKAKKNQVANFGKHHPAKHAQCQANRR